MNVIKHILQQIKCCEPYWKKVSSTSLKTDPEPENFLSMLSRLSPWKGSEVPDKVVTVKCNSTLCLEPSHEYLIWGMG